MTDFLVLSSGTRALCLGESGHDDDDDGPELVPCLTKGKFCEKINHASIPNSWRGRANTSTSIMHILEKCTSETEKGPWDAFFCGSQQHLIFFLVLSADDDDDYINTFNFHSFIPGAAFLHSLASVWSGFGNRQWMVLW